jgi:enamine deaminase RidA (YjgF/YER057c/UK114 family)
MRRLISSGSAFEADIAYSRAVCDGGFVFVSGCTGFDYAAMTMPEGAPEQAEQAFRNIESALRQAGAAIGDIVRIRYILPAREDFEPCWPVIRRWLGDVRPAATMLVAGLLDPRMRIEIEATARLPDAT